MLLDPNDMQPNSAGGPSNASASVSDSTLNSYLVLFLLAELFPANNPASKEDNSFLTDSDEEVATSARENSSLNGGGSESMDVDLPPGSKRGKVRFAGLKKEEDFFPLVFEWLSSL